MTGKMVHLKRTGLLALVCTLPLWVSAGVLAAERSFFAMDTYITMSAYGQRAEEALEAAGAETRRLEDLLSAEKEESDIACLNRDGRAEIRQETFELLSRAKEIWEETDGAFNIAVCPLMQAWGFPSGAFRVPEASEIEKLLPPADPETLQLEEGREGSGSPEAGEGDGEKPETAEKGSPVAQASLEKPGMALDPGGIAKGYASSRLMDLFREYGLAGGLVNLGGNVQVLGSKPDGSPWRIGIEDPEKQGDYLGILEISDRAVITSGGYERYFEEGGIRYHHILDPSTGRPAEKGVISATVVSPDGTLADALSTALFVMGKDAAADFWQHSSEDFEMILLDEEGVLWITEGLKDSFRPGRESRLIERQ